MRFSAQLPPSNKLAYSSVELVIPKGSLLSTSPFHSYHSPSSRRGDVFTLPRLPSSVPSSVPSSRRGDAHTLPRLPSSGLVPSSGRGTAHTLPEARPSFSAHIPVNSSLSTAADLILATLMVVSLFGLFLLLTYRRPQRRRDHPPQAPEDGGQLQQQQHYVLASPSAMHVISVSAEPLPLPIESRNPIAGFPIGSSSIIFTYSELFSVTKGFSNLLGEGGFGYVYKGTLPNGKEVAIKRLESGSEQGESEFQAEVNIIRRIHHRHLVSLVGYCIEGGRRLLVYNFVPNNTMKFHLHGRSDCVKPLVGKSQPTIDWATRLKIALGSAKGFAYLHEGCHPQIIHRDIKADNILLDFEFEAQIADFGLSKIVSTATSQLM